MTPLDAFLPHVRLYAPGVADPAAFFAIRQAAIAFCERTKLWRADDAFDVSAGDCEALFAPYGAVIHQIEAAHFDGQPLEPKSTAWLDDAMPAWREGAIEGQPAFFTQTAPDTVTLVPRGAGLVRLWLRLKPSQDAQELPDFMAAQHRETIAHGALARLLLIPNQSFTNADMGAAFGALFHNQLEQLATLGTQGQQRAPMRSRGSYF